MRNLILMALGCLALVSCEADTRRATRQDTDNTARLIATLPENCALSSDAFLYYRRDDSTANGAVPSIQYTVYCRITE